MKLRLSGPTVRLRLDQEDVTAFSSAGRVEAALQIPGSRNSWRYALVASPHAEALSVSLTGDGVEIVFPAPEALAWAASDRVGLYGQVGDSASKLEVKVEKDLGCDHESGAARR